MNKRQINSIKKVIAYNRNIIKQGGGYYSPSPFQAASLKWLFATTINRLGFRDAEKFRSYLNEIDAAESNQVSAFNATEKQLAAIEKAVALCGIA